MDSPDPMLLLRSMIGGLALRQISLSLASHCPDGHPKLLHLWPVKLLQAGRSDYDYVGVMAMREAASFRR